MNAVDVSPPLAAPAASGVRRTAGLRPAASGEPKREAQPEIDRRNWITGLEKGLSIIRAFDIENGRLSTASVARLSGLSRSSARRHLMMLTYLGYADTDGKQFWLTPKVLRLGGAYLRSAQLPRAVQPYLQRVTAMTGENAFFSVLDEDEVVCVARNAAPRVGPAGYLPGTRLGALVSAAGIALLAAQDPGHVQRILEGHEPRAFTRHTFCDKTSLRARVAAAARDGHALLEQQFEPDMRGVAVPVRDHKAQIVGALSVVARVGEEPPELALRRLLPALLQVAAELMSAL
jgi:IclR family transcriptional regulator, pca regulon regulatory protein